MKWSLVAFLFMGVSGFSQNYHAIHGSPYEAGLNVNNNPAAILNSPYKWDLTLFGTQLKSITNAFTIFNYSLLSNPANSEYAINNGDYGRKADLNFNTNLLNTRISLSRTKGIAFGINLRGYGHLNTSEYNYVDTINDVNNFLTINPDRTRYNGKFRSSSWVEIYGSYSQTIFDNERGRLNAGVTLKVNRGLSGGFVNFDEVTVQPITDPARINYLLRSGSVGYGYSSNYDRFEDNKSNDQHAKDFVKYTEGGASIDLGVEYLVKTQAVNSFYDEDDGYYEYEWKIGLSLVDLGRTSYKYGARSRFVANPKSDFLAASFEDKFANIQDADEFNDSLATIVNTFNTYTGKFNIFNPARMIVNVDRYIINDFYVNGELSLNLSPLAGDKRYYVKEMSLLTVTPRWETRRWGGYLPLQVTQNGKFWIGAAFKAGPLLLGVHNLSNLFTKNSMQNGGGYLAIIFHPGKKNEEKDYRRVDCP